MILPQQNKAQQNHVHFLWDVLTCDFHITANHHITLNAHLSFFYNMQICDIAVLEVQFDLLLI